MRSYLPQQYIWAYMPLFKLCNALWIIVKAPRYKLPTLLALCTLFTLLPPSSISFWHEIKYSYYAWASQNCHWTLLKVMKSMILDDIKIPRIWHEFPKLLRSVAAFINLVLHTPKFSLLCSHCKCSFSNLFCKSSLEAFRGKCER